MPARYQQCYDGGCDNCLHPPGSLPRRGKRLVVVQEGRKAKPLLFEWPHLRTIEQAPDACAWRIESCWPFLGFRDLGRLVPCATGPSCFSVSWRQSPDSAVPVGGACVVAESVLLKHRLL